MTGWLHRGMLTIVHLAGWSACIALAAPPDRPETTAVSEVRPILQIADRPYLLRELLGVDEASLKKLFLEDAKQASEEELEHLLPPNVLAPWRPKPQPPAAPQPSANGVFWAHAGPDTRMQLPDRKAVEEAAFVTVRNRFLDMATNDLVLAYAGSRIVTEIGIDPDEYFNVAALEDALKRQHEFQAFLRKHFGAPPEKAEELNAEAVKHFRFCAPEGVYEWLKTRSLWGKFTVAWVGKPDAWFGQPKAKPDSIYRILPHYLLKDAAENGIYHERAMRYQMYTMNLVRVVELQGIRGHEELLKLLASDLTDRDGCFRGWNGAIIWGFLGAPPKTVQWTLSYGHGKDYCTDWQMPPVGVFYSIGPDRYRLLAWNTKPSVLGDPRLTSENREHLWKDIAYPMALTPWLPEVKSLASDWKTNAASYRGLAQAPFYFYLPGLEVDPFVKKPVSGMVFREWEEERDRLAAMVVEGAHVTAAGDGKARADLVRKIDERINQLKTEPARKSYRTLRNRLAPGGGA